MWSHSMIDLGQPMNFSADPYTFHVVSFHESILVSQLTFQLILIHLIWSHSMIDLGQSMNFSADPYTSHLVTFHEYLDQPKIFSADRQWCSMEGAQNFE